MFGDYYTPNIVSGAPTTSMIGNQIDLYFHVTSQPTIGAALTLILSAFLVILMAYYMVTVAPGDQGAARHDAATAATPAAPGRSSAACARLDRQPVGPAAVPRR